MVDNIEKTDGYGGLYGEVVTADCYRLHGLDWKPDVVLDIGANIGVFSRYARSLFPDALIVAVEPNWENHEYFLQFTPDFNKMILLNKAIGKGQMWHYLNSPNGAHQCYMSEGTGYPAEAMAPADHMERSDVKATTIHELIERFVLPGQKAILKLDIEGNEHTIFSDRQSMEAMKKIDYIAMELHWYAAYGNLIDDVISEGMTALSSLGHSHNFELQKNFFFAHKIQHA